ncbi:hypothetical protein JW887_07080 [Candidatus Dojkabacteria bacterium]|nr:hypothetical protein [Candidatus Dojkabacteria bacterium]
MDKHFENKEEIARPLFNALVKAIEKNIGPIKIESLPCCIHLVSNYTFGGVWAQRNNIKMDFRLDKLIKDKRFIKTISLSKNRFIYYLEIKNQKEIDKKLMSWIKAAYYLNNKATSEK